MDPILISVSYYTGLFLGLIVWMFYLYWIKHEGNPIILFDKKYLVPFFMSVLIAAFQIALELMLGGVPLIPFENELSAFMAGFAIYIAIQEIWKGILKYPRINYFKK
jgi:hypothetical protein